MKGVAVVHILIILLLIIPAIEIFVFLWIGQLTNIWFVLMMIILTGIAGIHLAKQQGLATIQKARFALDIGKVPGREIIDGIAILLGALLLITPGFVTDLLGFFLLIPWSRNMFIIYLRKYFQKRIIRF